jgi:hypothetical protein
MKHILSREKAKKSIFFEKGARHPYLKSLDI